VDKDILWFFHQLLEFRGGNDKDSLRQVSRDAVVVNVVTDAESLLKLGVDEFSLSVDFTLALYVKNVAVVFKL